MLTGLALMTLVVLVCGAPCYVTARLMGWDR